LKNKKEIVFILPGKARSGGVIATCIVANKLIERGHNVRILYRKNKFTIKNLVKQIINVTIHARGFNGLQGFKGKKESFKDIRESYFKKDEIIIGVGMIGSSQIAPIISVPNPKLQYIHGEHSYDEELCRKTLSLPVPKVVVSSFLNKNVELYGGKVLEVIPNGVDTRKYYNSVNESHKDGIGTIYSSAVLKDPETILSVLEILNKCKPKIAIRVFSSHRRPKQIPRSNFCRFPSIKKAREIYSRSKVWIVASKSEGFSMPVLEAMACGCVVVATKCGGPNDLIKDGVNGFLVNVGDVNQIVNRVLLLLNDENLRNRMLLNSRETVKKFNWDSSVDKLEKTISQIN
jgi:glycosyltransferase involved in cell wall biosynthesis